MNRFYSLRPFALILAAVSVLALTVPTQAAQRAHVSRGTAHFTSASEFEGSGTATHLGAYTESGTVAFSPTDNADVIHLEACATYTAANGDRLYAVFSGELNQLTGVISATVTYVGGTGRFTDASGTATLSGQMFPDGSIEVAVQGNIDY